MKYIMNIFKGDICFSTSDIGWIVGHVFMVYGPLLRGATTVLFEGKPVGTPNSGKVWEIIQKYNESSDDSSSNSMDENKEVETVVEEFAAVEEPVIEEAEAVVEEPEAAPAEEFSVEEPAVEEEEVVVEAEPEVNELQVAFDKLNKDYTDLKALYEEVVNSRDELSNEINDLKTLNESLKASVATYEAAAAKAELDRKNDLVEKYEKILDAEEINVIKDKVNDLSYEELEGKLAIVFAHKKMADEAPAVAKVPLQEPEESQFALLIKKYRKN